MVNAWTAVHVPQRLACKEGIVKDKAHDGNELCGANQARVWRDDAGEELLVCGGTSFSSAARQTDTSTPHAHASIAQSRDGSRKRTGVRNENGPAAVSDLAQSGIRTKEPRERVGGPQQAGWRDRAVAHGKTLSRLMEPLASPAARHIQTHVTRHTHTSSTQISSATMATALITSASNITGRIAVSFCITSRTASEVPVDIDGVVDVDGVLVDGDLIGAAGCRRIGTRTRVLTGRRGCDIIINTTSYTAKTDVLRTGLTGMP